MADGSTSPLTTLGPIGGTSTSNGGTIALGVLSLAPANATNGGVVTNGDQTFGGDKTFTQNVTADSFVKTGGVSSQYLMADGSTSAVQVDAIAALQAQIAALQAQISPCGYAIGQNVPALGGIIFYLDPSGCHGLVCARTDQSAGAIWQEQMWNGDFQDTNAYADCVGGGAGNTSMVMHITREEGSAEGSAIKLCYGYGEDRSFSITQDSKDWYLPSKYELNLMYKNIGQGNVLGFGNVGFFANSYYWSSTEVLHRFSRQAWGQNFGSGSQNAANKDATYYVRAVRAF